MLRKCAKLQSYSNSVVNIYNETLVDVDYSSWIYIWWNLKYLLDKTFAQHDSMINLLIDVKAILQ